MEARGLKVWEKKTNLKKYLAIIALIVSIIALFPGIVSLIRSETALQEANNLILEEKQIKKVIEEEAALVVSGQVDKAVLLYADNASITDNHGGNFSAIQIWSGKEEISERYSQLPRFEILQHNNVVVIFGLDKTYARAESDTIGTYIDGDGRHTIGSNHGEKWTFEKVNGEWKIISFTYNLG